MGGEPVSRRAVTFQVGDRVKYAARFLRAIGCYTGPLPFARGTITEIIAGYDSAGQLAAIDWQSSDVPAVVNTGNLVHAAKVEAD